jgi:hypothetical protein
MLEISFTKKNKKFLRSCSNPANSQKVVGDFSGYDNDANWVTKTTAIPAFEMAIFFDSNPDSNASSPSINQPSPMMTLSL